MNRAQRRQKAALETRKRKISTNPKAYTRYRDRATLWARGATLTGRHIGGEFEGDWSFAAHVPQHKHEDVARYATHAPLRWHVTAALVLKRMDGQLEVREAESECGQIATVEELHGLREALMDELKSKANMRLVWDEYFLMKVM